VRLSSAEVGVRIDSRAGVAVLAVLLVGALVAVGLLVVRPWLSSSRMEQAVEVLPSSVLRVSWTDWAQVREEAEGEELDADSSAREVREFLDRAFDQDLVGASALSTTFPALAAAFGVTPFEAEWEVYGQAREGSAALLKLDEDVDLEALEERFEELGYQAPSDGAGAGGTWVGTPELVVSQDERLDLLQENLAVLPDERLFVMSDDPGFVDTAVAAVEGDEERLDSVDGLGNLVGELSDPVTATVWVDDFACEDLAMSQADRDDVETGRNLVEAAGGVHPLDGLAFAQEPGGSLEFVMGFETEEQADADLQPRTDLASGPAPGQGGAFTDRFELTSSTAQGAVVTMRARPVGSQVLADLGQGPILFATC
jgi:hypothetical protein